MLRRKLLLNLGPLVLMMLVTAVGAIWLLQGVLREMQHIHTEAWQAVEDVNDLTVAINTIEVDLYHLDTGRQRHLDQLIASVEQARGLVARLGDHYLCRDELGGPSFDEITAQMPVFERHVGALATSQDGDLARVHTESALAAALKLRHAALPLSRYIRDHAHDEQEQLAVSFQRLVLGMALVFVLVINTSVIVLLRLGWIIIRPVERLIEATEALGREEFSHRVELRQHDEFDKLGEAYNALARQLQSNEKRRIEVLQQVALTVNQELNNALSIIELQLHLVGRHAPANPAMEKHLREIRHGLQRVTEAVQSLKQVRRIVLTDYLPGTKMLDLRRSVEADAETVQPPAAVG
jgi:HAMP domain-containing protein